MFVFTVLIRKKLWSLSICRFSYRDITFSLGISRFEMLIIPCRDSNPQPPRDDQWIHFRLYLQEKWQRCYPDWFSNGLGTLNKLTTSTARGFKTPINVVHYSVCSESPVVVWQPRSVTNRPVLSTRVILKFYRLWLTYNLRQNSWESCQTYVSLQDMRYKLTKLEFISSTLSPKPIVNCNLIFSVPQRPTLPRVGREG